MNTILVPFDFSDLASGALGCAAMLARGLAAKVRVLHVLPTPPAPAFAPIALAPSSPSQSAELERQIHDAARSHGATVEVEFVTDDDVGGAIVRAADRCNATLIAMGTRGLGGVARVVLGSVADAVMRNANCPVVTVRIPYVEPTAAEPLAAAPSARIGNAT